VAARTKEINESAMMNEEMRMLMKTRIKEGERIAKPKKTSAARSEDGPRETQEKRSGITTTGGVWGGRSGPEQEGERERRKKEEERRRGRGRKESEREQYAQRRKHLHLIIDRLSIALPVLSACAYSSESLCGGMFPTVKNPPCRGEEPSGAPSWTASAGGTSAFSI